MWIDETNTELKTVVNTETGEVLETTQETTHNIRALKKCTSDEFIMVYLKDLSGFLQIDNGTQIKLLSIIWREIGYNNPDLNEGNVLAILKDDKERWAKVLNVTVRTIENALSALVKKKLLLSDARGKYKLNPLYYFKGTSKDRLRILNLRIDYNIVEENDIPNAIEQ